MDRETTTNNDDRNTHDTERQKKRKSPPIREEKDGQGEGQSRDPNGEENREGGVSIVDNGRYILSQTGSDVHVKGVPEADLAGGFLPISPDSDSSSSSARTPRKRRAERQGRPPRPITHFFCGSNLREVAERIFPAIMGNDTHGRLLEYLLFNAGRFSRGEKVLLPHGLVLSCAGQASDPTNSRSGAILRAFKAEVLPGFSWKEYAPGERTREVEAHGLPDTLIHALSDDLRILPTPEQKKVWFGSGKVLSPDDAKVLRERMKAQAEDHSIVLTDDAAFIRQYLHAITPRIFTSLINLNASEAHAFVQRIADDGVRMVQNIILRSILAQPQPFYRPVSNSHRLFEVAKGLQGIKSEARHILLRGCFDIDADALHLAIVATVWDVSELKAQLARAGAPGLWRAITEHMAGRALTDEEHAHYKASVKHPVYAFTYGGGSARIAEQFSDHDETGLFTDYDDAARHLLAMPALAALHEARQRIVQSIIEKGGMDGYYGFVEMKRGRTPLSVLSMVSSSYELALMRTLFDVAAEHQKECSIVLYQFDGVTVRFRTHDRQRHYIIRKMRDRFGEKATELGIITSLKVVALEVSRQEKNEAG